MICVFSYGNREKNKCSKIQFPVVLRTQGWGFVSATIPDHPFTSRQMFSSIITCKSPGQPGKGLALTRKRGKDRQLQ